VQGGPNNIDIAYQYDGLFRRTRQIVTSGTAPSLDFYYNNDWKIIEERLIDAAGALTNKVRAQNLYGVRNRNDLILRDFSPDGIVDDVRHYALSDAMYSTTAIASADGGNIQQRFHYTAFGVPTFMGADFSNANNVAEWQVMFFGEYHDLDTLWSSYGYRDYPSVTGTWESRDIDDGGDNWNLYTFFGNNAINENANKISSVKSRSLREPDDPPPSSVNGCICFATLPFCGFCIGFKAEFEGKSKRLMLCVDRKF
jgi:RHS repeat-associated protein